MTIALNPSPLDTREREALAAHEATIERGLQTFVEVGTALAAIRDERLYRTEFDTFEAYAWQRWRLKQSRVYQLMEAAEVVGRLESSTIVELPANEAQARPLTQLAPEQQPVAWQRAVETAPNGKVTAAHVSSVVRSMTAGEADDAGDGAFYEDDQEETDDAPAVVVAPPLSLRPSVTPPAALVSSLSNEWYTPAVYVDAARAVMGGIDLDPASSEVANRVVQASVYCAADDDGLAQEWYGRVWLNPPYGRDEGERDTNQTRWTRHLLAEFAAGHVTQAVVLVNGSALSTRWFAPLWAFPVCVTDHRIRFLTPAGEVGPQPAHGSAFVYLGPNVDAFDEAFSRFGVVAVRRTDWSSPRAV